ncbi:MAG: amino acid permease [Solirubrobacterales bacterium]|nr:amino acid permease [Solirubrobacterales bacterium]MBV9533847.1 amino acid permease [Solirubrobacterales bacterium]
MATQEAPQPATGGALDSQELAGFGYKQELDRSLGSFSSFAAGFSYISILTGVTALFGLAYSFAGPGVWWTWPVVIFGQVLVALCFMEMAGQYPIAGSVYQWGKQISGSLASWMTGWMYLIGAIVTITAVAIDWQVVLPQISSHLQFAGTAADAGFTSTKGGAQNALLLGGILIVITTIINMLGVKLMSRINNFGVIAELIGSSILVILLLFHLNHGPGVIFHSHGYGAGHPWGYFGALLLGGIVSVYVMYGFDTAGTLAEETNNPRKHAPPAIIRAVGAAALIGGLVILFAILSNKNLANKNIGLLGLPFVIKQAFGNTTGNIFLADCGIAIFVCCLAVQTATIRMLFSMARDNKLPFGSQVARVSGRRKVPIVPALLTGILAIAVAAINVSNQSAFAAITSIAIIMFYICYMGVTVPMLLRRLRGQWPKPDHGPYFSMGRWGLLVNIVAVFYQVVVVVNLMWPRSAVYNALPPAHWYFKWAALLFVGLMYIIGFIYYFTVQVKKPTEVLAEHRADVPDVTAATPVPAPAGDAFP